MAPTTSTPPETTQPQEPVLRQRLLSKLPEDLAASYSDEQVEGIRVLLGDRTWGKHSIDKRGSFAIPFFRWRFYWVFLVGRNRRAYSRTERHLSLVMLLALVMGLVLICMLLGVLGLYLLKSWLGIDILPSSTLGLWDWINS